MATSASIYNQQRTVRQILKRHRKEPPSLVLHINNGHFHFAGQAGIFPFDSPARIFLDCIRQQRVPADLLDILHTSKVAFYEGCLIIEVHDHRPPDMGSSSKDPLPTSTLQRLAAASGGSTSGSLLDRTRFPLYGNNPARQRGQHGAGASALNNGPEIYRIVLHTTGESLWEDLKSLDADLGSGGVPLWSDEDVLRVEAGVLALTSPPLCLTPDPHASRIANTMLAATAPSIAYNPPAGSSLSFYRNREEQRGIKRSSGGTMNSTEAEEQENKRRKRLLVMNLMKRGTAGQTDPTSPLPGITAADGIASSTLAKRANGGDTSAASTAQGMFVPTFTRMKLIEKFRMERAANDSAGIPRTGGVLGGNPAGIAGGAGGSTNSNSTSSTKAPAGNGTAGGGGGGGSSSDSAPLAEKAPVTKKKASAKKGKGKKDQQDDASTTAGSPPAPTVDDSTETTGNGKGKKKGLSKKSKAAQEKTAKAEAEAKAKEAAAAAAAAEKAANLEAKATKGKGKGKGAAVKKGKGAAAAAASPAATEEVPATPASEVASLAADTMSSSAGGKGKKKAPPKKAAAKGGKGSNTPAKANQSQQSAQPSSQGSQPQAPADMTMMGMNMLGMNVPPNGLVAQGNNLGGMQLQGMTGIPGLQQQFPFVQPQQSQGNLRTPQGGLPQNLQQQFHAAQQINGLGGAGAGMMPMVNNPSMAQQLQNALAMSQGNPQQIARQAAFQQAQRQQGQPQQQIQLNPDLLASYQQMLGQMLWQQQQQQPQ